MYIVIIDRIFDVRSDVAEEIKPSFWERIKGLFSIREKKFNVYVYLRATGDFGDLVQGDVVHVNHQLTLICSWVPRRDRAEFRTKVTGQVPVDYELFHKIKGEYPILGNAFIKK